MREITFSQATMEAMAEEMARDERVFLMGKTLPAKAVFLDSLRVCRSNLVLTASETHRSQKQLLSVPVLEPP